MSNMYAYNVSLDMKQTCFKCFTRGIDKQVGIGAHQPALEPSIRGPPRSPDVDRRGPQIGPIYVARKAPRRAPE